LRKIIAIAEEGDRLHRKGMGPKLLFRLRYPKLYGIMDQTLAWLMNDYVKTSLA